MSQTVSRTPEKAQEQVYMRPTQAEWMTNKAKSSRQRSRGVLQESAGIVLREECEPSVCVSDTGEGPARTCSEAWSYIASTVPLINAAGR